MLTLSLELGSIAGSLMPPANLSSVHHSSKRAGACSKSSQVDSALKWTKTGSCLVGRKYSQNSEYTSHVMYTWFTVNEPQPANPRYDSLNTQAEQAFVSAEQQLWRQSNVYMKAREQANQSSVCYVNRVHLLTLKGGKTFGQLFDLQSPC